MSIRRPSEGIAFEPLSVVAAGLAGASATVLVAALAWHQLWKHRPKEHA